MLPRVDVVLPDELQPRPSATGTLWSDLRGTGGDEDDDEEVTLHEPTTQEMLQYELMRLTLDPKYEPRHPKAWHQREIVLLAATRNDRKLKDVLEKFKNDKEVVMAAVKQSGMFLRDASEALQKDKEVVMAAVTHRPENISDASEALQKDPDVRAAAVAAVARIEEFQKNAPWPLKDYPDPRAAAATTKLG